MSVEPLGVVSPLMPGQGQPIQVGIVSNQTSPFHILGDIPLNSLHGTFVVCPKCNSPVYTKVSRNCSCLNCCFFCYLNSCWWLTKCCHAKDYNCYDAKHSCPKCGYHIGTYSAF